MFGFIKKHNNQKLYEKIEEQFHENCISKGYGDLFKIEAEPCDYDDNSLAYTIRFRDSQAYEDLLNLSIRKHPDKTDTMRFSDQFYSNNVELYGGAAYMNEWCTKFQAMFNNYKNWKDELEVLRKCVIHIEEDKPSANATSKYIFKIDLRPVDFKSYFELCEKTYRDFKFADAYKNYIVNEFAKKRQNRCYNMEDGTVAECGEFQEIHTDSPKIYVYTYNQWLQDIYYPKLEIENNDLVIKELKDLVAEARKSMPK